MNGLTLKEKLNHGDLDHALTRDEVNKILELLENEDMTDKLDDAYHEGKDAGIDEGWAEGKEEGFEHQEQLTRDKLEDLQQEHGTNLQAIIDGLKEWLED